MNSIVRITAILVLASAAGAYAQDSYLPGGYTCCNLHYDRDWISDANWGNLPRIAPPEKIRAAIRDGKVVPGMTREQAVMSIGYPPTHRTRSTDEPVWHVWGSRAGRYEIHWNKKGTVEKIVGHQP